MESTVRQHIRLTGVVQGVGFRPHVASMATRHGVSGFCGNDDNSVFIEVEGTPDQVDAFSDEVVRNIPPMASVVAVATGDMLPTYQSGFHIVASRRAAGALTLIPPDAAICVDCLSDMADPLGRRYQYPFTTCTNCGPRLSIIRDVPYDRPLTTMVDFPMCELCFGEYENPRDRRFHAQPISCFDCGPTLWLEMPGQPHSPVSEDRRRGSAEALTQARTMLAQGRILAVKGIGGFTVMCEARNESAVALLRDRKNRRGKPLAVMAGSIEAVRVVADLSEAQDKVLTSREAPIVLAPKSAHYDLAPSVAPGLDVVGVMMAYSPLHQLLVEPGQILVATSANSSSLPLTYREQDARNDLSGIVDGFLMHDRIIEVPVEDSVVMADGGQIHPIRRSRGYAPLPVFLGDQDCCVLGVGAELKNTFALTRDGMAFLSAHIGDMGSLETQVAYEKSVAQMMGAHRRTPELIVVDKHPGYATHRWGINKAHELGVEVLEVQHHHGHALSLVAESRMDEESTFVVLDGTGYGDDGTIWGGEILRLGSTPLDYERVGHLPGFLLPGGDSAVRHPWKSALGVLNQYGIDPGEVRAWQDLDGSRGVPTAEEIAGVSSQLQTHLNCVFTTSTGRLFDAVSSILGICHQITYEAQAAMELEAHACNHEHQVNYTDVEDLIAALLDGVKNHCDVGCLAHEFHTGLAHILVEMLVATNPSSTTIGLTGGVFANRLLTREITTQLARHGFTTVTHHVVPANDGGLSLGQAYAGYLHLVN